MVKQKIAALVAETLAACESRGILPAGSAVRPFIETPREEEHGDYSTNVAFLLAPVMRRSPGQIAALLIENMDARAVCDRVEMAGKGFINFYVRDEVWREALDRVKVSGVESLFPAVGSGTKVLIEFVSANPTGPLHIGHGRGAAVGDVLGNVLRMAGYEVTKEYYVNDAGRQIEILGQSTYERLRELKGEPANYEKHFYQGGYVRDLARRFLDEGNEVPPDRNDAVEVLKRFSSTAIMNGIVEDLDLFGVRFDNFFRESTLYENGAVEAAIEDLRARDCVYEQDGATWFRTSRFQKDEDRVFVKSGGEKTYFASDMAYHRQKLERGYEVLIDIWGSDHHGYIPRMKAAIEALGKDKESLKVLLIQFVSLVKDGKPVGMSTRSGQFTTLKEVLDEVGTDAARFFFLMRKCDAHLDFDLDLAKKTSNENPVFYVQYAHARISSIFRNAEAEGVDTAAVGSASVDYLALDDEIKLVKAILRFSDVVEGSARSLEPHRITFYLLDLVAKFHSYYNKTRVLGNEQGLTMARLLLLGILRDVIRAGLGVLGVSAPETM